MPLMLGSKTYDPVDNFNTTPGFFDEHPCIGLYFATPTGHRLVSAINPLPVTGGGGSGVGITDTDDNSIAPGQTTLLAIDENYIYDAVAGIWIRWEGGVDNAVAPALPQGAFVGGIVTDPVDVFVDGDISLLHFDTSGRLLCNATFTFPSTEDDDNAIPAGALARAEVLNIPYFSNLDNASIWERWTGRNDDDSVDTGDGSPTIIGLNYVWDRDSGSPDVWRRKPGRTEDNSISEGQFQPTEVGLTYVFNPTVSDWVRLQGGTDNAVGPATPQIAFVGGIVTDPVDVFADGDVSALHFDTSGRLLISGTVLVTPFATTPDDDSIATGATLEYLINLPYFSNLDNAGTWERWTGRLDDDAIPTGDEAPNVIPLNYYFNRFTTNWERTPGDRDDGSIAEFSAHPTVINLNYVHNADGPGSPNWINWNAFLDDDSIPSDGTHPVVIDMLYQFNIDSAAWERLTCRTDDNSVPFADSSPTMLGQTYIATGAAWIRWQGGVDNAVAVASPQGGFVGGVVTSPLAVFADGDVSLLHFDTSGRLLTFTAISGFVTDVDDNLIASGQTLPLIIDENYVHDGTNWIRLQGSANNAVAPAAPQGAFTAGIVRTSFDVFAAGDAYVPQGTVDGATIVIPRTQEPFEVATSQAAIAASGVFTSASIQQNSLFAGSLGRHNLQGFVNYTGAASSLTVEIQISLDSGATFITTDRFTVVSGTATVIRDLCIAMGNRLRIQITNNDGASGTGTTNIGFYLTHAA